MQNPTVVFANDLPRRIMEKSTSKMSRPSNVFFKVDREGLLTDTVSLSDVVNFDCYESIVGSVQRILAKNNAVRPECIAIDGVFYYKKRARSTRMNPVCIRTTTDGFRAVAEHPTGEVPLGVSWTKTFDATRIVVKVELNKDEAAVYEDVVRDANSAGGETPKTSSDSEIPEKRRKLNSPTYKTYMPTGIEEVKSTIKSKAVPRRGPTVVSATEDSAGTDTAPSTTGNQQQKMLFGYPQVLQSQTPQTMKEKLETEDGSEKRYPYKSQYQWPDNVTCEVIMNYDGITERKTLAPGLAFVIQSLLKGNYSVLSREVSASLCLTKLSGKDGLNELHHTKSNIPSQTDKQSSPTVRAPIKYLQDAKSEIFKVLTLLNLSKARFKQLLDWMRSLKLEEGKQGKFYLSERTTVGNGLHVTYDTNEEAANKLNQIYKSRAQQKSAKVLHAIDPSPCPSPVQVPFQPPVAVQQEGTQKQFMFLLPHSGTTGELVNLQNLQTTSVSGTQTAGVSVAGMQHIRTSQGLVQVTNGGIMVPMVQPQQSQVTTTATQSQTEDSANKTSTGHSVPSILRRKLKRAVHKSQLGTPVPMQLYKSQHNTESDSENVNVSDMLENTETDAEHPLGFVKHEPVDYTSDTTEDYDRTSDKGLSPNYALFGDTDKRYHDVLKSDAQMPQSSEQNEKPFEVIIKSEPMDDYKD